MSNKDTGESPLKRLLDHLDTEISSAHGDLIEGASSVTELFLNSYRVLGESFQVLTNTVTEQQSVLQSLISGDNGGDANIQNPYIISELETFINNVNSVIDHKVDAILMTSKFNLQAVNQIDDAADKLHNLLEHQLGQNEDVNGVLHEVVDELQRTRNLLGEVATNDMSKALEGKAHTQRMLGNVDSMRSFLAEKLEEMDTVTHQIEDIVNAATEALQSEDIMSQMLGRSMQETKLVNLFIKSVLDAVLEQSSMMTLEENVREVLEAHKGRVEEETKKLPDASCKNAGDSELF